MDVKVDRHPLMRKWVQDQEAFAAGPVFALRLLETLATTPEFFDLVDLLQDYRSRVCSHEWKDLPDLNYYGRSSLCYKCRSYK